MINQSIKIKDGIEICYPRSKADEVLRKSGETLCVSEPSQSASESSSSSHSQIAQATKPFLLLVRPIHLLSRAKKYFELLIKMASIDL